MKKIDLVYVVHFQDLTGKPDEQYVTDARTAGELIDELDGRYPGFRALMLHNGSFRPQNEMVLYRKGIRAHGVFHLDDTVEDGDYITFL